jgi:DNA-binding transcriptional ArsR family regulator
MAVTKLRTQRSADEEDAIGAALDLLKRFAGENGGNLGRAAALVERELAARRGWGFVMVEPRLYADVVEHLTKHSHRPQKAVVLFTRLFQLLPADGNEVRASRDELAQLVGIKPRAVTEIMGELEAVGAVYRRKEGRRAVYYVNPLLGTHLGGTTRDKAQAEAPPLRLRLVEPAE